MLSLLKSNIALQAIFIGNPGAPNLCLFSLTIPVWETSASKRKRMMVEVF